MSVNPYTYKHLATVYGGMPNVWPAGWSYANGTPATASNASVSNTANPLSGDINISTEITIPAVDELKKQITLLEQKNSALVLALNKVSARVERLEQQQANRSQKQQAHGGYWEET